MGERLDLGHVLLALWQRLQYSLPTDYAYHIKVITLDSIFLNSTSYNMIRMAATSVIIILQTCETQLCNGHGFDSTNFYFPVPR